MNLNTFKTTTSTGEVSLYKNIPIQYLDGVKAQLGTGYRYRWRGPRANAVDGRHRAAQQSTCLKDCADRFSVYKSIVYTRNYPIINNNLADLEIRYADLQKFADERVGRNIELINKISGLEDDLQAEREASIWAHDRITELEDILNQIRYLADAV